MATEKLQPNQVYTTGATSGHVLTFDGTNAVFSAPVVGGQVDTKYFSMIGGSADITIPAFGFVVGHVYFEFCTTASNNATDVHIQCWANMRSHSGTRTANITNRRVGFAGGKSGWFDIDRTTSGTVLVISRPDYGTFSDLATGGAASTLPGNWHATGTVRVTAWEDMQGDAA